MTPQVSGTASDTAIISQITNKSKNGGRQIKSETNANFYLNDYILKDGSETTNAKVIGP